MKKLTWILVPTVVGALLVWGAWATTSITDNTPRKTFEEHCQKAQEARDAINAKIDTNQRRVEDKLDDIQKFLMENMR